MPLEQIITIIMFGVPAGLLIWGFCIAALIFMIRESLQ